MQANEVRHSISMSERKKKVEAALVRLRSLKCHVSELRKHCENLKKQQLEKQVVLTCSECGKLIQQGQEVTFQVSFG
jgi:rubrerythrin